MDRRQWLKSSAILSAIMAAGASAESLAFNKTTSFQTGFRPLNQEIERSLIADLPPLRARLLANENPFGPAESAKKAMIEAMATSYQYPFLQFNKFKKMIADKEGVSPDQILMGAGSSELLMASAIVYAAKGGNIVTADPSYMDLIEQAADFGAPIVKVPLDKDYVHDLAAMEAKVDTKTSLVYICNPNNPTGTVIAADKLRSFCESVSKKAPVFIDEAYIDYADPAKTASMIELVKKGMNVIVARTFSKVHGFAGLRMGYVVGQPDTLKALTRYSRGSNISALALQGAMASYQDNEFIKYAVAKNTESKEFLYKTLKAEGYSYVPSHTNFVLFPVKMPSRKFMEEMMKRGVGVRNWEFAGQQWCRVSMGTMNDMQLFASAFKEIS